MWFSQTPLLQYTRPLMTAEGVPSARRLASHTIEGYARPLRQRNAWRGGFGTLYVSKRYHAQGPCVDNAKQVMNAVENNFSTFGNFKNGTGRNW